MFKTSPQTPLPNVYLLLRTKIGCNVGKMSTYERKCDDKSVLKVNIKWLLNYLLVCGTFTVLHSTGRRVWLEVYTAGDTLHIPELEIPGTFENCPQRVCCRSKRETNPMFQWSSRPNCLPFCQRSNIKGLSRLILNSSYLVWKLIVLSRAAKSRCCSNTGFFPESWSSHV